MKRFDLVMGNPPYATGIGKATIYHFFVEKALQIGDRVMMIIQRNWMTQPNSKVGKVIRESLKQGVASVRVLPDDTFTAQVKTCILDIQKGQLTTVVTISNGTDNVLQNIDGFLFAIPNPTIIKMIQRLRPVLPYRTLSSKDSNSKMYRIATSYRSFDFYKTPIETIVILSPGDTRDGYRVFDEFETLECAKVAQINYTMFWKSSFVTTIMRMTRSSSTLDNPQIAWVPKVDLSRTWTDQELYAHFGLTEEEIRYIEEQVK